MTAFIRRSDLARDRSEQRPERFAVGEKVDARVTQFDKNDGKIGLSIKALEIAEEKAAVAQYRLVRLRCIARRHSRRSPEQVKRLGPGVPGSSTQGPARAGRCHPPLIAAHVRVAGRGTRLPVGCGHHPAKLGPRASRATVYSFFQKAKPAGGPPE
jgi:hypothetical protein